MIKSCTRLARSFLKTISHFISDKQAIAAVEFALILPIMLFAYIGTAEVSRLIIMDRRLAVVAGSVGDLVARANGSLQNKVLQDYFAAAEFTMAPYPSATLKQVVTGVFVDKKGKAKVYWSKGYNGGSTYAKDSYVPLPPEMSEQSKNKFLIIGEATTQWQPIVDFIFQSGFTLEKTYYYRPRFDAQININ
ncbi:TadE/TadG family type IV pilus assembly protein [Maritalea porphyrae]|uniref:TadE/TadG family type IV pilus assembly protein n=1 Tax=Maritalea porphyrae TaxID=880732 RepID=UPI0022AEE589|nr:TadE/TadG family type IV pilus assembly protein [Maritalea porphyrae]MCZ4271731.1 pilus assembly protein [Maritalea porphyrae]